MGEGTRRMQYSQQNIIIYNIIRTNIRRPIHQFIFLDNGDGEMVKVKKNDVFVFLSVSVELYKLKNYGVEIRVCTW